MTLGLPNKSSEAAELGTAVHELVECALRMNLRCKDLIGTTFNGFVITDDMADSGQVYVAYIRNILAERPNAVIYIELKVCLSSISDELWGTSDVVIVDGDTIITGDYKNGWVTVEVNSEQYIQAQDRTIMGNSQTIGYTLAAMDTLGLWGTVTKFINFIGQPNVEHVDGEIRSEEYTVEQMVDWHNAYRASHELSMRLDAPLNAGSHCKYCLAAGFCAPRIKLTVNDCFFDNATDRLNEDQIMLIKREIPAMRRTLETLEEEALKIARSGKQMNDFKLVKTISKAKCVDEDLFVKSAVIDEIRKTFKNVSKVTKEACEIVELDLKLKMYNKPKLKGMTANKKFLNAALVNTWFVKPEPSTTLVDITNARTAVMPDGRRDATQDFDIVTPVTGKTKHLDFEAI